MGKSSWMPSTVPYGADQTVYLVIDRFRSLGSVYRETEVERTDIDTIISDPLTGQFNDPIRVVAFNTLEHWSDDVSDEIATEFPTRCDIEGAPVPDHLSDFVTSHTGPARQLAPAARLNHAARAAKAAILGRQGPVPRLHRTSTSHLD